MSTRRVREKSHDFSSLILAQSCITLHRPIALARKSSTATNIIISSMHRYYSIKQVATTVTAAAVAPVISFRMLIH